MVHECLKQEVSGSRWIDIPDGVRELYVQTGPAHSIERIGLRRVRIYYNREDLGPTGSHKVNTALLRAPCI